MTTQLKLDLSSYVNTSDVKSIENFEKFYKRKIREEIQSFKSIDKIENLADIISLKVYKRAKKLLCFSDSLLLKLTHRYIRSHIKKHYLQNKKEVVNTQLSINIKGNYYSLFERDYIFKTEIFPQRDAVYLFLKKRTGNTILAEDLTQDTMMKAINKLSLYRKGSNPKGWLIQMAKNIHSNYYRKHKNKHTLPIDDLDVNEDSILYKNESFVSAIDEGLPDELQNVLETLDEDELNILLKKQDGYTDKETAQYVGIKNPSTLRKKRYNIRKMCKSYLGDSNNS